MYAHFATVYKYRDIDISQYLNHSIVMEGQLSNRYILTFRNML
jgi:hypothetical protein